MHFKILIPYL